MDKLPVASLPEHERIDVGKLSSVFRDTATSYKYLFLRSIVDAVRENQDGRIGLDDLSLRMLVTAWYPHTYFKLSFGKADKIGTILDNISPELASKKPISFGKSTREDLYKNFVRLISEKDDFRKNVLGLQRFVPYRLLATFFKDEVRSMPDHKKK